MKRIPTAHRPHSPSACDHGSTHCCRTHANGGSEFTALFQGVRRWHQATGQAPGKLRTGGHLSAQAGRPPHEIARRLLTLLLAASLLATGTASAQLLSRKDAVNALLDPGSGVSVPIEIVAVWSPFEDLGGGAGHEGQLPVGASVAPRFLGFDPFPGSTMSVSAPSYFFWIDDAIAADFMHPTRFVLVRADRANPTVANGGITLTEQGWWPRITLPGGETMEFFAADFHRVTTSPPGFSNPDGLVAGVAPNPTVFFAVAPAGGAIRLLSVAAAASQQATNAAGLVINGSTNAHFSSNVVRYADDLTNHYGVASNRVIVANTNALPANSNQVAAAIANLCALQPPPDKIYIRICSHGGVDAIQLGSDILTGAEFCRLLQPLAGKGARICMLIQACHSRSLVDANLWGFPTGSVVIVSADSNRTSHGGSMVTTNGSNVVGSVYSDAFSKCLATLSTNGPPSDIDVHRWVTNQNPCYGLAALRGTSLSNVMFYPAGDSTGWPPDLPPDVQALTNDFRNPGPRVIEESIPRLQIEHAQGLTMLSWSIMYPGFQAEVTLDPASGIWDPINAPAFVVEDQFIVEYLSSAPTSFFRLIGSGSTDTQPPSLVQAFVEAPSVVGLVFSEPLNPASIFNPNQFQFISELPPFPQVTLAQLQPDQQVILLFLNEPLAPSSQYIILVSGVSDLAGNSIPPGSNILLNTP